MLRPDQERFWSWDFILATNDIYHACAELILSLGGLIGSVILENGDGLDEMACLAKGERSGVEGAGLVTTVIEPRTFILGSAPVTVGAVAALPLTKPIRQLGQSSQENMNPSIVVPAESLT